MKKKSATSYFSSDDHMRKLFKGVVSHGTIGKRARVVYYYALYPSNGVKIMGLDLDQEKVTIEEFYPHEDKGSATAFIHKYIEDFKNPKVDITELIWSEDKKAFVKKPLTNDTKEAIIENQQ